jgi:hypothetical protein
LTSRLRATARTQPRSVLLACVLLSSTIHESLSCGAHSVVDAFDADVAVALAYSIAQSNVAAARTLLALDVPLPHADFDWGRNADAAVLQLVRSHRKLSVTTRRGLFVCCRIDVKLSCCCCGDFFFFCKARSAISNENRCAQSTSTRAWRTFIRNQTHLNSSLAYAPTEGVRTCRTA